MKLYGKNPIIERLRAQPQTIRKIYIQDRFNETSYIRKKAKKWNIPVVMFPKSKMDKIGRNKNTQGLMADVDDVSILPIGDLLDEARKKGVTVVFLDEVTDPQNLGAMIRSLGCFGRFALILPTHKSASVTESVLRVASGGENYVQISIVGNINKAIKEAKDRGFKIAGAVVGAGESLEDVEFPFPLGLVVGSEEKGVRDVVRKNLDIEIFIPMLMSRMSFNVAHATAIIAYEINKQKNKSN